MRCRCVPNGADVLMPPRSAEKGHFSAVRAQRRKTSPDSAFVPAFGTNGKGLSRLLLNSPESSLEKCGLLSAFPWLLPVCALALLYMRGILKRHPAGMTVCNRCRIPLEPCRKNLTEEN